MSFCPEVFIEHLPFTRHGKPGECVRNTGESIALGEIARQLRRWVSGTFSSSKILLALPLTFYSLLPAKVSIRRDSPNSTWLFLGGEVLGVGKGALQRHVGADSAITPLQRVH